MTKIVKKRIENNSEEKVIVAEIKGEEEVQIFNNPNTLTIEEVEKRNEQLTKKIKDLHYLNSNISFIEKVVKNSKEFSIDPTENLEEEYCIVLCNKSILDSLFRYEKKENFSIVRKKEIVEAFSTRLLNYTKDIKNQLENEIIK